MNKEKWLKFEQWLIYNKITLEIFNIYRYAQNKEKTFELQTQLKLYCENDTQILM